MMYPEGMRLRFITQTYADDRADEAQAEIDRLKAAVKSIAEKAARDFEVATDCKVDPAYFMDCMNDEIHDELQRLQSIIDNGGYDD